MRAFVLLSLAAFVSADVGGYNYQQQSIGGIGGTAALVGGGGGSGLGGLGGGSSGLFGSGSGSSGLGGLGGGSSGLGGGSSGLGGSGSGLSGIGGGSSGLGGSGGGGGLGGVGGGAELNKEFYSFSAPEQEFDDQNADQHISNTIKKNLRVIFIRAPENKGLESAALNLAKQASEDKTAIYVLTKQADVGNLAQQLQNLKSQSSNKPEVHFVKYRTPQDAANAQQAIQSQYDSLGGTSHSHNGGVAPVLNFASQAPVKTVAPQAPGNAYLPSSIFRRFRV